MEQQDRLSVEWVTLERLFGNPGNPRVNDAAVPHVAASIRRFGWQQPVVARRSGEVIAGNTRLKAALELGAERVPVVWFEGSDLDAVAYAIADNRTAEFAEWDQAGLAQILEELRAEDALEGVGFTGAEIDELLAELEGEAEPGTLEDPGPEEPPEKAVSQLGDLWILGEHRLLCGDSTRTEDVQRVMGEDRAALCASDPPYLVDYTGSRPNDSGKDWTASYREIDIKDAEGFFRSVFEGVLAVLAPNAAIYCWHAHKRCGLIQRVWEELGILDHQQIVWVKPASVFGRVYWHFRHEPCMLGWKKGSQPPHDGQHEFDSVWEVDWLGKARVATDHPTSKPVELFARPMRKTVDALRRLRALHQRVYGRLATVADPVFLSPDGRPWGRYTTNCVRILRRVLDRAGIPWINQRGEKLDIHALRHSAATRLLRNGAGLAKAQRLLGHSDPKLTAATYGHLEADDLRDAVEALPSLQPARQNTAASG